MALGSAPGPLDQLSVRSISPALAEPDAPMAAYGEQTHFSLACRASLVAARTPFAFAAASRGNIPFRPATPVARGAVPPDAPSYIAPTVEGLHSPDDARVEACEA